MRDIYFIAHHNDPDHNAWGPFSDPRAALEFAYDRGLSGWLDPRLYAGVDTVRALPVWARKSETRESRALRPEDV